MVRLPVSGAAVVLRAPDGADDMALGESLPSPARAGLLLIERVCEREDGTRLEGAALSVTDFEILLLRLRQRLIGDRVSSDVTCPSCRERVEISFRVDDYVSAVRPRRPRNVTPAARPGWLAVADAEFRLPIVADLLAIEGRPAPGEALRSLCLAPGATPAGRRRAEGALARIAPQVTGPVGGACPGCHGLVEALFDVPAFVVAELRRLAAAVYAEVHLLASSYGWAEAEILALPGPRRRRYAEMVRGASVRAEPRSMPLFSVA
jgi:hypothetical protein